MMKNLFDIIYLRAAQLEVSYNFATIPVQLWIFSIFIFGGLFVASNGKLKLPNRIKRIYMTVIPVASLAISIGLGVVLKSLLIKHLTNNGYQLTETIQASKPWYFDKEVYELNVTNISSAH
ncbi:hypothetical protein MKR81_04970 [Vibrio campbellii]|uniref:hypothetical protein n=1 Tax=Vibrio campbellii TaxID=680 RepID=UPI001F07A91B|nr:hypothetical protein [Vibrio campbellii]UMM03973.1 hypothetical protein MKR81_04970 [Vibrio campbellii]